MGWETQTPNLKKDLLWPRPSTGPMPGLGWGAGNTSQACTGAVDRMESGRRPCGLGCVGKAGFPGL